MAFFAVQVRTGKELQAKEMINYLLKNEGCKESSLVKKIYALQQCTAYVCDDNNNKEIPKKVNETDVYNKLVADSVVDRLGNLKKQYETLKNRTDKESTRNKNVIKEKISELENDVHKIKKQSKTIKSVIPGYIIIELNVDSDYLPDQLWHLINKCPLVQAIPNRYCIPPEEIKGMFEESVTETQIEIQFEEVLEYKETIKQQKELVHKANKTKDRQKEKEYLKQADDLDKNIVSEVNKMKKTSNAIIDKIKAFIKNKKQTVSMPVSLFHNIYKEYKGKKTLPRILPNDFIHRIKRLIKIRLKNPVVLE